MSLYTADIAAGEILKTHCQIVAAKKYHIQHKGGLKEQIHNAAHDLSAEEMAQSQNEMGRFRQRIAVPEIQAELLNPLTDAQEKSNDSAENPQEKAPNAFPEILEEF
jgi:hypothetical protein